MVLSLGGRENSVRTSARVIEALISFTQFVTLNLFWLNGFEAYFIISNTDNLSRYLQGEQMDVFTANNMADAMGHLYQRTVYNIRQPKTSCISWFFSMEVLTKSFMN